MYLALNNWRHIITNTTYNDLLIKVNGGGTGTFGYMINSNIYDYLLGNIDYIKCEIDLIYNNLNMRHYIHSYKFIEDIITHNDNLESNIRD